ncbi:MAG: hypothetical protein CVV24_12190 [Ignavibacteriae bacterium HGW-Ignavibacteriae-3]|nr:MAG: hypothetical protein CVV24_12190 [Ignavibacteriae bacterium HGW-Ignavibacteriae-3]
MSYLSKIYFLVLIFLSSCFAAGELNGQDKSKISQNVPVALHRTEIINITSDINGITYPINIALPGSYFTSDKTYPVVYMLDAYSSFGIVTEMARLLASSNELPEIIIVGISSAGGSKEFVYNRSRDYTPTQIPAEKLPLSFRSLIPVSGGGDKFFRFIKEELIPLVESKYRFKPGDRTLAGHSLGGLFVFYSLFREPDLFNRYVAISPALLWDDELMAKQEETYFEKNKSLIAVVYTAAGSDENSNFILPWKNIVSKLTERNYSGLKLKSEFAERETHYSIIPYIVTHGLKSVFETDMIKK